MPFYTLIIGSFIIFSPISKKNETKVFVICAYIVLSVFASIRFGMGTDYFSYYRYFSFLPDNFSNISFLQIISFSFFVEPGFYLLVILFKTLNLSFSYFIAFFAFLSLGFTLYTIQKYSKNKNISLLIFFANYYMVYMESALRQGIAMAIFIYAFYDFITKRKKIKYFLLILIAMTFHVSVFITMCIPFIITINTKLFLNPIFLVIMTMLALMSSIFIPKILGFLISLFYKRVGYFDGDYKFNIFPIGLRILEMILIYTIFKKTHQVLSIQEKIAIKFYMTGMFIYFSIASIGISRLSEYFIFIEIILIPNLLSSLKTKSRYVYHFIFACIFTILFFKDINASMYQQNYVSKRIIDYQYVTIFNKEEIKKVTPSSSSKQYFSENP
jgi:hypothetical protein